MKNRTLLGWSFVRIVNSVYKLVVRSELWNSAKLWTIWVPPHTYLQLQLQCSFSDCLASVYPCAVHGEASLPYAFWIRRAAVHTKQGLQLWTQTALLCTVQITICILHNLQPKLKSCQSCEVVSIFTKENEQIRLVALQCLFLNPSVTFVIIVIPL